MVLLPISINIRVIYLFEIHFKICRVPGNKRSVLTSGMMFAFREFSTLLELAVLQESEKSGFSRTPLSTEVETWHAKNLVRPSSPPLRAKCREILHDNDIYSESDSIYRETKWEPILYYGLIRRQDCIHNKQIPQCTN